MKQQDENLILVADPSPFPDKNLFWRSKFWIEPKRANHHHPNAVGVGATRGLVVVATTNIMVVSCGGIAIIHREDWEGPKMANKSATFGDRFCGGVATTFGKKRAARTSAARVLMMRSKGMAFCGWAPIIREHCSLILAYCVFASCFLEPRMAYTDSYEAGQPATHAKTFAVAAIFRWTAELSVV